MSVVPAFSEGQIEALARVLGDCGTGSEITVILARLGLDDHAEGSTKWWRFYDLFLGLQRHDRCANRILNVIQAFLSPTRFIGRNEEFETKRAVVNEALAFSGIKYGADGKFRRVPPARTLTEAEQRANSIRAKFRGRRVHSEVLKYCRAELMEDNYFHAVFEATKGLAQRIRELSGVDGDGAALVDRVFLGNQPVLAFNTLQTEMEKSEQKGIAALLKGCFAAVRNPLAHEPKILWDGEDDAADCLTLLSLLHRKLDDCTLAGWSTVP